MKKVAGVLMLCLCLLVGGVFVVGGGSAYAVDVSGEVKLGYPINTYTDHDRNDAFTLSVDPDFILEGAVTVAVNEKVTVDLGLDILENVSFVPSVAVNYFFTDGAGVFVEHDVFDMSDSPNYNVTWAGVVFKFGN